MRTTILQIIHCPKCQASLTLIPQPLPLGETASPVDELRKGTLCCVGSGKHEFQVEDGIVLFECGLQHELVQQELAYEDSTYHGDQRLTKPAFIAQLPESGTPIWPHTRHFGPDFRGLLEGFHFRKGGWILDIGTGACWTSRLLAERASDVVALDVNAAQFYGLRASDVQFDVHGVFFERVLASMTHLPFRSEVFDYIVFNASFHHTPALVQTLEQCYRVLRPGGAVVMLNEVFTSLRHWLFDSRDRDEQGAHHKISYTQFERAARQVGFEVSYAVPAHVEKRLNFLFPMGVSRLVWLMEWLPLLLKQLNSAVVTLRR